MHAPLRETSDTSCLIGERGVAFVQGNRSHALRRASLHLAGWLELIGNSLALRSWINSCDDAMDEEISKREPRDAGRSSQRCSKHARGQSHAFSHEVQLLRPRTRFVGPSANQLRV